MDAGEAANLLAEIEAMEQKDHENAQKRAKDERDQELRNRLFEKMGVNFDVAGDGGADKKVLKAGNMFGQAFMGLANIEETT